MFRQLAKIAYFQISGHPVIMYLGIFTLFSFILTAAVSVMNRRGIHVIPFKWHPRLAFLSICLAIIHGILAVSAYL